MAGRRGCGERAGPRLDARCASCACPPSGEVMLERLQFRVGETEQHDADIVEAQRSFGRLSHHLLLEGQLEPECAALPGYAVDADLPPPHLHPPLRHRTADP